MLDITDDSLDDLPDIDAADSMPVIVPVSKPPVNEPPQTLQRPSTAPTFTSSSSSNLKEIIARAQAASRAAAERSKTISVRPSSPLRSMPSSPSVSSQRKEPPASSPTISEKIQDSIEEDIPEESLIDISSPSTNADVPSSPKVNYSYQEDFESEESAQSRLFDDRGDESVFRQGDTSIESSQENVVVDSRVQSNQPSNQQSVTEAKYSSQRSPQLQLPTAIHNNQSNFQSNNQSNHCSFEPLTSTVNNSNIKAPQIPPSNQSNYQSNVKFSQPHSSQYQPNLHPTYYPHPIHSMTSSLPPPSNPSNYFTFLSTARQTLLQLELKLAQQAEVNMKAMVEPKYRYTTLKDSIKEMERYRKKFKYKT
ncbi:hypothetical protein P9112_004391 [Eukaryota sp. TZLM1-RC]